MKPTAKALLLLTAVTLSVAIPPFAAQRRRAADPDLTLHSVESGGLTRWYRVAEPPNPTGAPLPVVVCFHGGGGNAAQAAAAYGVPEEARARGYLAVFPEGTGKLGGPPFFKLLTWNVGDCCGYANENDVDDVGFFADMLTDLAARYPIDAERVFLTGMSNGAMMSYAIAVERPDLVAGIAPVAGSNEAAPPTAPVPLLAIFGLLDENVPFEGGVGSGSSGAEFTSQLGSILPFLEVNGGAPPAAPLELGNALLFLAPGPAGGADTWYMLALDGGHTWPGSEGSPIRPLEPVHTDVPATPLMFDFFEAVSP